MENRKIATPLAAILLAVSVVLTLLSTFSFIFGYGLSSSFVNIMTLLVNAALCVVLFMKRRDVVLLGVLAVRALLQLLSLSLLGFLHFLAWGVLLVLALCVIEQDVIKLDLSKISELCKKLFFVPAAVMAFCALISFFRMLGNLPLIPAAWSLIRSMISVAAVFFLAQWLLDPYEKENAAPVAPAAQQQGYEAGQPVYTNEAYCSLGKHIVLCLFTFGIWYMIWTYRTTRFLNTAPGAEQHNPGTKLLLCIFVPFYQIYWFYKQGQRIDYYCRLKNLPTSDMATICLILGIFIPIVACILMQDRINTICTAK